MRVALRSLAAALLAVPTVAVLLDARLAEAAAGAPHLLVAVGLFVTGFGKSEYMFAYSLLIGCAAVVALGRGRATWCGSPPRLVAERATFFFAVIALSGIVDQILKHLIGRARPRLLRVDGPFHFEPFSTADVLASFPSGHTTSAFAAAVALGLMRPAWRAWLIGAALMIGASRVLVGAHYPSDVVGGAMLGSAVSLALARSFAQRGWTLGPAGRCAVDRSSGPVRPSSGESSGNSG